MDEKFWSKKTIYYFALSVMVVIGHSVGYAYFDLEGINIDENYKVIVDLVKHGVGALAVSAFIVFFGILLFHDISSHNMIEKMRRRLFTLGGTYILWNTISVVWSLCIAYTPFLSSHVTLERGEFSALGLLRGILFFANNPPMWYMLQIIVFIIICPIVYMVIKNKYVGIIVIMVAIVVYHTGVSLYPFLVLEGRQDVLVYYLIGAWIGMHYMESLNRKFKSKVAMIMLGILTLVVSVPARFTSSIFLTLLFVYSFWLFLDLLPTLWLVKKNWWFNISFFIYALHNFIQPCINKLIWIIFPHTEIFMLINFFLGSIITILLCILIAFILKNVKCFNWIWNLLNGNIGSLKIERG